MRFRILIADIKAWNERRKLMRNRKLFMTLYKDETSGMKQTVDDAALKVGYDIAMGVLDQMRISHCVFCPKIAPLVRHPMGMLCQEHNELVRRQARSNPKQEEQDAKQNRVASA